MGARDDRGASESTVTEPDPVEGKRDSVDREAFLQYYEKSMFDPMIREYTDHSEFHNFGYWRDETTSIKQAQENLMEFLLGHVPESAAKVLDVACGKGATTKYLLRHFAAENIIGVDLGAKALELARSQAPGCLFVQMDAAELDFPSESFDVIVCIEAAFHFETREEFLRRAHDVLKPGGVLLMSDVLMTREGEAGRVGRTPKNYLDGPDAYRALLERCGFPSADVIDGTETCWRPYFMDAVSFMHRKLLNGEMSLSEMKKMLQPLYRRTPDLRYYLLVVARRG